MATLLVSGGCGFIGSNFIRHLLDTDPLIHVVNFDALTYAGNPFNLHDLRSNPRYRFIRGDVADADAVQRVFALGVDIVVHFAAESHVDRSLRDAAPFLRTNIQGTHVLLEAARTFGVERFVHVSTDEVYGSLGPTGRFTESSPLHPNNPYAASKAAADHLVLSYVETHRLPALVSRCSNNYGPYQFPEKLIPLFITRLLREEPVPLYGDGLNIRDWIHVQDHVEAIDLLWREGRVGEVYNIGGNCEKTNRAIADTLLELLHQPAELLRFVDDRPGHDRRYAMDFSKIERELSWRPRVSFAEGIAATVRWYREHEEWSERIRTGAYRRIVPDRTTGPTPRLPLSAGTLPRAS